MKNTIKTLLLATMVAAYSGAAQAQTWNFNGNTSSNTVEKIGLKDPVDLQFLTDDKVRLSLTQNGWLGLGTLNPKGWQEIVYAPGMGHSDNGLVVTLNKVTGGVYGLPPFPFDIMGSGMVNGPGETSGGSSGSFFPPISVRTGHLTTVAFPLYATAKPMFWVREHKDPSHNSQTGDEEYDTKFIVMPDGSCGINITNPRAALDVRGSQAPNRPAAIFGSRAIGTNANDPSTGLDQYYTQMIQVIPVLEEDGYNRIVKKNDQGLIFTDGLGTKGSNSGGAFVLAPWAEGADAKIGGMRMDGNGNTEFHGTIRATEVKINARWWSDFVFDDEYKLMSLAEVETFIKKNKHLPNVPSESEVLENGINVADMQAVQQQKIEELTLYLIELKKELDALKAEVATQKSSSH
tara:strand:+ start:409 stop:1623 length:1215 start_codon:yes stop_codon:yes gene_type:complete